MKSPLSYPAFRALFASQICSLLAVGLLTVALSLSAYAIGGDAAGGRILGLLLALKMVAYVLLAPLAETTLAGKPRKSVLIGLDIGRMLLLIPMAFVSDTWQIAVLAFAFFALSSAFTPLYQSVIPDILPDEELYTRALSWSRIAYTLEAMLSPVIAAAMLQVVATNSLFICAALAFVGSIAAILVARFPQDHDMDRKEPFSRRALKGLNIYARTPRLRGLFLLNFALALAMAWVLVNSVVFAGKRLGDAEYYFPVLMAFYGLGAAIGALAVPRLIRLTNERFVMVTGALVFAVLGTLIALTLPIAGLLALWTGFGLASSLVLTPGGLIITRSAKPADRPSVFAAQFSLSHAGWLLAYPLAGWLATWVALETALILLSGLCALVTLAAMRVWPATDPVARAHSHPELPDDHPHLHDTPANGPDHQHSHAYYVDKLHPTWATNEASY